MPVRRIQIDPVSYINAGHYQEAWNALQSVQNRQALWYYLAAAAADGMGNNVTAAEYAEKACSLEPDNPEYASLLQRLRGGGSWYERRGMNVGRGGDERPDAERKREERGRRTLPRPRAAEAPIWLWGVTVLAWGSGRFGLGV